MQRRSIALAQKVQLTVIKGLLAYPCVQGKSVLTLEDVRYTVAAALAPTAAMLKDDRQPIVVQARAQYLLDRKTTFDATERMYDRAFGKPTLRQEIQTNEAPPVIVNYVDGGKDNNIENNGE